MKFSSLPDGCLEKKALFGAASIECTFNMHSLTLSLFTFAFVIAVTGGAFTLLTSHSEQIYLLSLTWANAGEFVGLFRVLY